MKDLMEGKMTRIQDNIVIGGVNQQEAHNTYLIPLDKCIVLWKTLNNHKHLHRGFLLSSLKFQMFNSLK